MKPSFALDFRDGVIALLHRTSRGWSQVGSTPVDAPDLADALSYLRSTALGLSPRGLTTKLVIPNEMILYTQVHAPGPEVAKRRRQIKAALEGLTPYKVDDLVFDWWGTGTEVQVAVVARETLAEAEAFAVEHRLNPVSFVGAPDTGNYAGEPYFGPSALSATLLAEGEKIERDQDPVSVLARDFIKGPAADVAAAAPEPQPPRPEPVVQPEPVAQPEPIAAAVPEPPAPVAAEIPPSPVNGPAPVIAPAPADLPAKSVNPLPDFNAAKAPPAGTPPFDPVKMAVDLVDEAPMAVDVSDDLTPPPLAARLAEPPVKSRPVDPVAAAPTPPKPPVDDIPPSPASAVISAFASRRAAPELPVAKPPEARKTATAGAAAPQRPPVPRPTLAKPPAPLPSASRDSTLPFPTKSATAAARFAPGKSSRPMVSAPSALAAKRNVVQLPKPAAAADDAAPTADAKTATGLDGRPVPPRGKPRYLGLILTGLLLLALALVAAWSSFYLTSNDTDPNAVPASNAVASLATPAPDTLPTITDEALADGQDPATVAPAETATPQAAIPEAATPAAELPAAAIPEPVIPEPVAAAPVPEPAPATEVSTEAVQASTTGNDPQDEIFLADADTPPQTSDPLVLPQIVAGNDPPPQASPPPPPFGTLYTFDAQGLINPTPEGIVTPEGVLLIAGAPPVVPPTRPATAAAAVTAAQTPLAEPAAIAPAAAEPAAAEPTGADTFGADPTLADKRPKSRPAALVDPAAATAKQGEAPSLDTNNRFASLRPQARPAAMTTQVAAALEAPAAEAPVNSAAAASLALNGVQPSAQGLATSKKPAARPSGMDQAVNAAVAAAARTPEPEAQPQRQAAATPEAEPEPEVETAAPTLPTNASVAKQATVKDAINLNRVALLGIFGTASGRYAMIRQSTGGVKKVKVGDRIDGGQIAAITQNAVQYQKGGRMVTLSLPTG